VAKIIYAFIDSQNLNLGVQDAGWRLDFYKFRRYLRDRYRVDRAFLFIGNMPQNHRLYQNLRQAGFELIFKPTQHHFKDGKLITKGNVDAELVLYTAAILFDFYSKAIVVSGDGDFCCLYDYLQEKAKLGKILVPNKHKYSRLLSAYADNLDFVSEKAQKLAYKK
jgi:uncharacterized LabA/DUF88 family protein